MFLNTKEKGTRPINLFLDYGISNCNQIFILLYVWTLSQEKPLGWFFFSHFESNRKGDCFFSRGENVRKAKSLFWQPCGKRQGGEVQPTKVLQWVLMQSAIATIPMTHCEHPLPPKHHRFAPQESQAADSRLSGVGLQWWRGKHHAT